MNFRRPASLALAPVLVGLLTLTACGTSTPSNRRVAEDIIGSVEGLNDAQRQCMLDKLDGYSDDELDAIAESNEDVDFSAEDPATTEEFKKFEADLAECRENPDAASATTEGGSSSEPGDSEAPTPPSSSAVPTSTDA